ncbi:hypothetical protein [Halobiforma nitratireducens]|uniref:Uncharacterized protein n=1 Tax=Halobiforma nitratireducens JCM 10879 TaxID=1227454 RepID=M0MHR7_9EURY|nr:hypothetical protein [Halobiforma nitratireducens]EMA45246.1 hypothetical protein C446_02532 [Halobiforma nitratireducens JCM 10879]
MGDEPDGDGSSATKRVSLSLPESTFEELLESGPVDDDLQDAIKRAIWNQIERDNADEYTVVKNRE